MRFTGLPLLLTSARSLTAAEPIPIGGCLELFADDYLVESLTGSAQLVLRRPVAEEVMLTTDRPWERAVSSVWILSN